MRAHYEDKRPASILLRAAIIRTAFFLIGRATQSLIRHEPAAASEIAAWPEGFTIGIRILPRGPELVMQKRDDCLYYSPNIDPCYDLCIDIRTTRAGFRIFTARLSMHRAYAEHRLALHGNVADGMRFIRLMGTVQSFLFPKVLTRSLLKEVTPMNCRRRLLRLRLFVLGIPFGI